MTALRARGLAALVLVVAAVGCKKEGAGDAAELPAEFRPHLAPGDPAKLAVPSFLASVPADTPYFLASLDAVPPGFYDKMKQALQPIFEPMLRMVQRDGGGSKLFGAILAELDGKWNQAGLESLGLSTEVRFAIYGLGLQPAVVRLAVKDHKRLQATIERIAAAAGESLPAMATHDGRGYWRLGDADSAVVIALADNQFVAAVGRAADVDARLGLILGSDKPAQNMADGKQVKELMARHGFGGQLLGFADTRRIAGKALEAAGASPTAACTGEIDRLSAKVPRIVLGYGEMSAARTSGATIVELSPEAVAELKPLRVEVPGLAATLTGKPLFALGGGVDLARAQQLAVAIAGSLGKLGTACELGPLTDGASRAAAALARPLPEPAGRISGGVIAVDDVTLGKRSMAPEKLEGVAAIASPDARALFDKLLALEPMLGQLGITADGKLHDLPQGLLPVPFTVSAGVGDKLLVATAGSQRRPAAEKLLGVRSGGKAPFLAASYDYGKVIDLEFKAIRAMASLGADEQGTLSMLSGLGKVFGQLTGTLDVTDQGLAFWGTIELK